MGGPSFGEAADDAASSWEPLSLAASESAEGRLGAVRDTTRCPPSEVRPLAVLVSPVEALPVVVEDVDTCRVVRVAGAAGGPIDVRVPVADGRVLDAAEETRAFEGVFVLDTPALLGALICFVGDLVGDLKLLAEESSSSASCLGMLVLLTLAMLVGRCGLGTGLGLGAFRLRLFVIPGSAPVDALVAPGLKLEGRAGFLTAGLGAGGWATMVAIMGLTNMP